MRRRSREGRYAERTLVGVDDVGEEERIAIWIERRAGAVWVVGRVVNPQLRESDEPISLQNADVVLEGDGLVADDRPFTRKEVLPLLERWFFNR